MDQPRYLKIMQAGGQILESALIHTVKSLYPNQSLSEINRIFEDYVTKHNAQPGFKLVPGYKWGTWININHGLVHGIPHANLKIKIGDFITIDAGVFYQGYHTDKAITVLLTDHGPTLNHPFLQAGIKALKQAFKQIKPNRSLRYVSSALYDSITASKLRIIPQLGGHGIGRKLHQNPMVLQFVDPNHKYPKLQLYQTLAIEVIYTAGSPQFVTESDGWTLSMKDKSLAGMFEETIAVGPTGPIFVTTQSLNTICLNRILS